MPDGLQAYYDQGNQGNFGFRNHQLFESEPEAHPDQICHGRIAEQQHLRIIVAPKPIN
jgi:hypothetical protein